MAYPGKCAVEVKDHVGGARARLETGQQLDLQLVFGDWHRGSEMGLAEKNKLARETVLIRGRGCYQMGYASFPDEPTRIHCGHRGRGSGAHFGRYTQAVATGAG